MYKENVTTPGLPN